MKNRVRKVINKWLTVFAPVVNEADIPDYEGEPGYDAEMTIYDQIGEDYWGGKGVSANDFKTQLDALKGKKVLLRLHSPGGNVYDSMAMATAMDDHGQVDTKVDGLAASAAFSLFQKGKKRTMSNYSMGMAHKASSLMVGNSQDMAKESGILDVHDKAIAKLLAARSGKSVEDCMNIMDAETWMDGDECLKNNFCDELSDDGEMPENVAQNKFDLSKFKHPAKAEKFNKCQLNKNNGEVKTQPQSAIIMNREAMIALLKEWGVAVENTATDKQLLDLVKAGKPVATNANPAPAQTSALSVEDKATIADLKAERDRLKKENITKRVNQLVTDDKWNATEREWLINQSMSDDSVLAKLESRPATPVGFQPVTSGVTIDLTSGADVLAGLRKNNMPMMASRRGGVDPRNEQVRRDIGEGAKANGEMIRKITNRLCEKLEPMKVQNPARYATERERIICDWLESVGPCGAAPSSARMDYTVNGPYGSVDVSSDLQRQVIFSEAMRAFRRRLAPLETFAHNFGNIPLQGTDTAIVPYYPLYTQSSNIFVQSVGYQPSGVDNALSKSITVGGVGGATKLPGIGRAYQAMTWSAYLLRRQPWIDVQKLVVMRVEQLAFDVLNDIIGAWVLKANFGNAPFSGVPTEFDNTAVAALAVLARKSMWPERMRNLVIGTDYWGNLVVVPGLYATYSIGDSGVIREGRVGRLYGFEETIESPLIPATTDGTLVGWIAYPSAVLVATAPILPGPGEMKQMVNYDIVTDDQIGLSFEYKYFGAPLNSQDYEIVECNYGSGLGELAALKRLVSSGS